MSAVLKPRPETSIEIEATVTSKGQVTLPVALRERLGITEGTKVKFILDGTGIRFEAQKPISAYRGILKHLKLPDDIAVIPKEPDRDFDYILKDMDPEHVAKLKTVGLKIGKAGSAR